MLSPRKERSDMAVLSEGQQHEVEGYLTFWIKLKRFPNDRSIALCGGPAGQCRVDRKWSGRYASAQ